MIWKMLLISVLIHTVISLPVVFWQNDPIPTPISIRSDSGVTPVTSNPAVRKFKTPTSKSPAVVPAPNPTPSAESNTDSASVLGSDLGINVVYPRLSRVLKEFGSVIVGVQKNPDGSLSSPTILSSSGFQRLDTAATEAVIKAVAKGELKAAATDKSQLKITFIFKLTDPNSD